MTTMTEIIDEASLGDEWQAPKPSFAGRQKTGRIRGRGGKAGFGIRPIHQNRAGRRLYVKVFQTHSFRKSVLGWGRWRRHDEHHDHHEHARDSAPQDLLIDARRFLRAEQLIDYRILRKARCKKIHCHCADHGHGLSQAEKERRCLTSRKG